MEERPLILSRQAPALRSMRYEELRELGMQYIRELSGKVWTDHNAHDPGITILEALCYGITDLGHRVSFDIKDILSPADGSDIKNFHSATRILPNRPLTIQDYRKLLMDVKIPYIPEGEEEVQGYYGIKNAWLERSYGSETPVWVNAKDNALSYADSGQGGDHPIYLEALWSILLEFDTWPDPAIGDLNDNDITGTLSFDTLSLTEELQDVRINFRIIYPRWDTQNLDWESIDEIRLGIEEIEIDIRDLPDDYSLSLSVRGDNTIEVDAGIISGLDTSSLSEEQIEEISDLIHAFLYGTKDSLSHTHQRKVGTIGMIIAAARARLCANRNLCEDFKTPQALRVEEVAVCADVELHNDAEPAAVQAAIELAITRFLSPETPYYTLDEMLALGIIDLQVEILRSDKASRKLTVDAPLAALPGAGEAITLSGVIEGDYTIDSIRPNPLDSSYTDIVVIEELTDLSTGIVRLVTPGRQGPSVEEVLEGPLPLHGFISDADLSRAGRMEVVHVSDLIRLIMQVAGVVAVRKIQIANLPYRFEGQEIKSTSVRWCLSIRYEDNFVPRYNVPYSSITYYKNEVPILPSREAVAAALDALLAREQDHKAWLRPASLPVPQGSYLGLDDYTSLAHEFPAFYGVGDEGLPENASEAQRRSAMQMSSYLALFDQVLANEMMQLENVRNLFSMNAETTEEGEYVINSTYFHQSLRGLLPAANGVLARPYEEQLPGFTEDPETFRLRRNKFLDHLLARFSENMSQYQLLIEKLHPGEEGTRESIKDKLSFLNHYPLISSARGLGIDYCDPCQYWTRDNRSGLERRVAAIGGIDRPDGQGLDFLHYLPDEDEKPYQFLRIERKSLGGDKYQHRMAVLMGKTNVLMAGEEYATDKGPRLREAKHTSQESLFLQLEAITLAAQYPENFSIESNNAKAWRCVLRCGGKVLAYSNSPLTKAQAGKAIDYIVAGFSKQYHINPLSNRKNLSPGLDLFVIWDSVNIDEDNIDIEVRLYSSINHRGRAALLLGTIKHSSRVPDNYQSSEENDKQLRRAALWTYFATLQRVPAGQLGEEEEEIRAFAERQFFRKEGLHLVEHILLRPVQEHYYVPLSENPLKEGLADNGTVTFATFTEDIGNADSVGRYLELPIGMLQDFAIGQKLRLENNQRASLSTEVQNIEKYPQRGRLRLVLADRPGIAFLSARPLRLHYNITLKLSGADKDKSYFSTEDDRARRMPRGLVFEVQGSTDGHNDRFYTLDFVRKSTEGNRLMLRNVRDSNLQHDFLSIKLDQEGCEGCQLEDPYSYVASVVIPYWPGNFLSNEYRRYFERSLREEAPAHVFLNICWVSPEHMRAFEEAWKCWLLQKAAPQADPIALLERQNQLIAVLAALRNVYPPGTLHDCDEDDTLENSIILNNSVIGNA